MTDFEAFRLRLEKFSRLELIRMLWELSQQVGRQKLALEGRVGAPQRRPTDRTFAKRRKG